MSIHAKRSPLRTFAPLAALVALALVSAACPDSLAQLCPTGSVQAGVFNTTLVYAPPAGDDSQCLITRDVNDGGALDASLASGAQTFTSVICSGIDPDAGPTVYLALPTIVRASTLGDGGTFSFSSNSLVSGTACGCNIFVSETISGQLIPTTPDASVVINADGGLPSLASFIGTVVDEVDAGDDAGVQCDCNLPCDLQYALTGSAY